MLREADKQLRRKSASFGSVLSEDGLFSVVEAKETLALRYMQLVCHQHAHALDFVESMIRKQVVAAIGSQVTPEEFSDYMNQHNR